MAADLVHRSTTRVRAALIYTGLAIFALGWSAAELGGMLRTGLEDSFYLPSGERAPGNGAMIEALAACAERAGRRVASPDEARTLLGLRATAAA